jgi:hypothetical protein
MMEWRLLSITDTHSMHNVHSIFQPFDPHEISVLIETTVGHLCCRLTDMPPQPNSPIKGAEKTENNILRPAYGSTYLVKEKKKKVK